MRNEEKEESGQIPPKIKLDTRNGDSTPGKDAKSEEEPLEAKPVSGPKSDTSRVEVPAEKSKEQAEEESKEETEEKLEERESPAQDETMRVVLPKEDQVETGTYRKQTSEKPQRTIKIKRPQSPKRGEDQGETKKDVAEAKPVGKPKEDTSRIDLSQARAGPSEEQTKAAKEKTMQVVLDEASETGETTRQAAPSQPPRTLKIDRKDVPSEGETVAGPSEEEGAKTETAKLDIPASETEEAGARKTIRIKRPDTTPGGGKTLKISRPQAESAEAEPTLAEEPMMTVEEEGPKRPHAVFTIAAIFTVLITGTLIYVMCTQMPFGDQWPWPEKIITEWHGSTEMI